MWCIADKVSNARLIRFELARLARVDHEIARDRESTFVDRYRTDDPRPENLRAASELSCFRCCM